MPATETAEGFVVTALGPLAVAHDGVPLDVGGTKQRLLLAVLLIGADHVVSTDSLIDGLWGDDPPATARKALQMHVSNLRRALGEAFPLRTAPAGYVIQTAALDYDVIDFEAAVTRATASIRTDPAVASRLLTSALASWNGAAFADLVDEPAIRPEIARLTELRLAALERRIDADLRLGRHREVVSELETLTLDHPFHERFREQQMLALYRSGRQTDALRAYDRLRNELVEQLGIEPSPALQELRDQILRQSPQLDPDEDADAQRFAFLVTDLEDSTALWEADPEAMQAALTRHDALLCDAVAANAGSIFKETGDGIYAVFNTAGDAIQAGVDAQTAIAAESWSTASPLRVRMAVDEGVAAPRNGDYFGPALNRASRIMSSGHGGQLLVPATLQQHSPLPRRELGAADYRGIGRVQVDQVDIPNQPVDFPPLQTDRTPSTTAREGFGRTIRGYELREQLGVGAYGIVFRAYQASIGREVAIKVIRPELANRTEFVKRFEAEAQYVAQLEHPHIVPLYDFWRDPDGAYLVMQLLRGGSLADSLARSVWRPPAALNMLEQIGTALDSAHRQGVVHRDLKPANVLLDADGNAFLTDFGIAMQHVEAVGVPIESSVAYVSPEELAGRPVGVPADMYGLTLLAYETLTGDRPELGGQPDSVTLRRPDLPPAVDRVLERGAHEDPAQRYARVADFLRDLRQAFGADTAVAPADGPPVPIRNPFKGLRAFRETDAQDFFGRDELVEELVDHVARHRLTAVVGPSGCGKSSVVRAGLLPAARRGALGTPGDVLITEMYPGSYPFEELESALLKVAVDRTGPPLSDLLGDERGLLRVSKQILPDDDSELLLVIDQFEELFSLTHDEAARRQFLASLVEVIDDERSRVRIVVTLRADYFDRPLEDPEFGALLGDSVVPVAMPRDHELAAAIAQPARSAGLEFEPELIPRIVHDVADEPGALPLMQYALTALVDASEDSLLTNAEYDAVGGVSGALATRAEEIYEGMAGTNREAVPEVFLRLVRVDEQTDDTRRRARRAELERLGFPDTVIESVVGAYGSFRLLSFDRDPVTRGQTVEIAHEALIREWPRFGEWISERRESLLLEQRLAAATAEWEGADRSSDLLITGGRLEQFETWSTEHDVPLPDPERDFLVESRTATDEAERRRVSRRRRLTALVAVLAALACVAAVVALVQRNEANKRAAEARTQREIAEDAAADADNQRVIAQDAAADADSQRVNAQDSAADAQDQRDAAVSAANEANLARLEAESAAERADVARVRATALNVVETDPALAMLLAAEADRIEPTMDSKDVLHQLLTGTNGIERFLPATYTELWLIDNGLSAVALGQDGIDRWNLEKATRTVLDIGRPPSTGPTDRRVDVSDIGGMMAISDEHGTHVHELELGELTWSAPRGGAAAVAFSPDGTQLAIAFAGGTEIWDLAGPEATEPVAILPGAQALGWHPRGAGFVIITPDASVEYWPLGATEPAWSVTGRIGQGQRPMILFNSDGNEVVATQSNEADPVQPGVRLFSVVDGSLIGATRELATPVDGWMWFNEDERRLGIIGTSKNAVALDLVNGGTTDPPFESLTAFTMAYSNALERYVVGGTLGIALHDPAWSGPLERRINFVDPRRLDHRGGPGTDTSAVDGMFRFMSLSEDGTNLLVSGWSAATGALPIEEYDLTEDRPRGRVSDLTGGGVNGANGHTLLASSDGIVMLDAEHRPVGDPVLPDGRFSLVFGPSPDGRFFTVNWAGAPGELYRSSGELVTELVVPGAGPGWLDLSFSNDGSLVAGHVYGTDPTSGPWAIWDTDTGEMIDRGTGTELARPWLAGDTMYVSRPTPSGDLDFDLHRIDPETRESVGEPLLGQRALRVAVYDDGVGDLIVTHSFDGTVRLWGRDTGDQIGRATTSARVGGHPRALQLGGDGTVLTRIDPVAVSVWNLDIDNWADAACEFAGRNMTAAEWAEFGPDTIDHRATCPQYPIDV